MRIGIIGGLGPDTLTENMYAGLLAMGFDVVHVGPVGPQLREPKINGVLGVARRLSVRTQAFWQRTLVAKAEEAQCDLLLTADKELLPDVVAGLRKVSTGVAIWYPDHVANVSRLSFAIAPYTGVFVTDPLLARRLSGLYGAPAHYLPEACDPLRHRPIGVSQSSGEIVVVGNFPSYRVALLKRLHEAGVPLRLYGPPIPKWLPAGDLSQRHSGRYIVSEEKSRVFREAVAVINNLHPAEMTSVNCRLFEATGAGAVVLTEERPTLASLFDVGREVLTFDDFDSLLKLCWQVIESPTHNREMGDLASARSHRDHTYAQRLNELIDRAMV